MESRALALKFRDDCRLLAYCVGRTVNIARQRSSIVGESGEYIYTKDIVGQSAELENSADDDCGRFRRRALPWAKPTSSFPYIFTLSYISF